MKHTRTVGVIAAVATVGMLAGCAGNSGTSGDDADTLKIAAFEGGYGSEMYEEVVAAYEKLNPDVKIKLTTSKTLADELTPQVAAGDYPDLVVLGLGAKEGFTESFVRDSNLEDLTSVLDAKIPGEDVTVGDKLTPGIVGNLNTNPYGDDEVYLMPMYASPTGLVYNQKLFADNGWTVPTTWDEMFELGDEAKAEGISLFTYPTAGYLDSYFFSLLSAVGGPEFLNDVLTYKKDVWKSDDATEALELTTKLLSYAAPTTVGYANGQDFTKNQQTILDGTTLFMPNGSWIANEMKDAPRTDGFQWGLTPVPAPETDGTRYLTTFVESAWVPKEATNKDAAKDFIAYLYSDEAADIFAKANAIQPIQGLPERLTGEAKDFYAVYSEPGVEAVVGAFAATKPVPGVDLKATLFDAANSVLSGTTTLEDWQNQVNEASNKLTDQLAG
ncbi:carbohydrate ABC transporter substrate-binding protein [Plantibacter sp. Leaf171]|uniref:carbohydrate ABC transporter substrate-binding protein n=1 Tax=unclassified Plantibacter TaxID=2624265 RepID=UPI0006F6283B|nr:MULTISPECIES: carbohydrate ABC transporter substrate-binding protein [unclassified Plantibacter]KQM17865.1 carbohydrate ABC transporter substrate-binding protein [Plantibacter sp. Leaf1]KQR60645.1 carbohydrate ABC transporter substrate-binding protein [Plantibacter sp. Leaf171]